MNKLKGKCEMGNVENTITQVSQARKLGEVQIEERDFGSISVHIGYKEIRKSDFNLFQEQNFPMVFFEKLRNKKK